MPATPAPLYCSFQQARPLAQRFVDFVNRSKSPWHAVSNVRQRLEQAGFRHLRESESWSDAKIGANGKFYFTRNQSTIVAFAVGGRYKPGNAFKIIGAHTDSPDLRIRPVSAQESQDYLQVGVAVYGGALLHTWFDRDLSVAGRAIVRKDGQFEHKLFAIDRPILRIPNLAIHLNREVNDKGFQFSKEKHLQPVLATVAAAAVREQLGVGTEKSEENKTGPSKHHPLLMDLISKELECTPDEICEFEASVTDSQPATIGGAQEEFIFAPRIDNLMSCFIALESFLDTQESLQDDEDIRIIALFDHEEIGSASSQGADSALMADIFKRLNSVLGAGNSGNDLYQRCLARSYVVSADCAHAVHPNYPEKHHDKHKPQMHRGLVLKTNVNQRYATNAVTGFLIKEIAKRNNIPMQDFVVSNDSACGSTIGPILAANTGARVVDVGIPQLSMHSIREQCGVIDLVSTRDLFSAFWKEFRQLDDQLRID